MKEVKNIEKSIFNWIALEGEIKIDSSEDKQGEKILEVVFCRKAFFSSELIELSSEELSIFEVQRHYPSISLISQAIISSPTENGKIITDDIWFEERDNRLGIYYHEKYRLDMIPKESLMEFILSYMLTGSAYVEITQSVYQNIIWMHAFYQEENSIKGWGEYLAFEFRSENNFTKLASSF